MNAAQKEGFGTAILKVNFNETHEAAIKAAIKIAHKSTFGRERLGVCVTNKKGIIIAKGTNSRKTHPIQKTMSVLAGKSALARSLHAEIAAIIKCKNKPDAIYVPRVLKNGMTACAKLCSGCIVAIKNAGISKIFYTGRGGLVDYMKI